MFEADLQELLLQYPLGCLCCADVDVVLRNLDQGAMSAQ